MVDFILFTFVKKLLYNKYDCELLRKLKILRKYKKRNTFLSEKYK